ncbi:MAG TPA: lysophospholipid acyltransferase family protein [Polyangia bacterium]|jgi:1-acyl-sn-glycerol-3-phosphate acyltransferase|nr:lysophospholipid acyltransferase family protein [Polyangia bacterium]
MSFLRDPDVEARVDRLELPFNKHGRDPYGIQKKDLVRWLSLLAWFYKNYFHVAVENVEHVPVRGGVMLVGNHSGGVALDGAMVLAAMLLEREPPRLAHAMAEKFMNMLPFVAEWASRCGQLTGLPEQAARLLNDDRMLLVFPEGARGTAKLYWERNSLVDFGSGFVRLALSTNTPIVPFAFIGGGDAIPTFMNLYRLGKLFGAPYIPVTPWLLPIPRRVPLKIVFGEPMIMTGSATDEDAAIEAQVEAVKQRIAQLIGSGEQKVLR